MRLSDLLSKPPKEEFTQVDGFLLNKKGSVGQQVSLSVGNVALNYFCNQCEDLRTFSSKGNITCIFVNKNLISIDSVLTCVCGTTVEVWFLVECENDITSLSPKVRILKRCEKLSDDVTKNEVKYGKFDELLCKAEHAYDENLGAGAIVYLRKIFEMITVDTANAMNIDFPKYDTGNPRNFTTLLEQVDDECSIIPKEFSENGKRLFKELSSVVHGDFNEEIGLAKFEPLYRLVIGILENVKNKEEYKEAMKLLNWFEED